MLAANSHLNIVAEGTHTHTGILLILLAVTNGIVTATPAFWTLGMTWAFLKTLSNACC